MNKPSEIINEITGFLADTKRINMAFASLLDCCLENYGDLPLAVMNEVARCCERIKIPLGGINIDEYGDALKPDTPILDRIAKSFGEDK